jgi:hypothetical protein
MEAKFLSASLNLYLIKEYSSNNHSQILVFRTFLGARKVPKEHALKKNC